MQKSAFKSRIEKFFLTTIIDPYYQLNIKGTTKHPRTAFKELINEPDDFNKAKITISYDIITTKQKDERYIEYDNGTYQLKKYGYYEAALVGDKQYFIQHYSSDLAEIKGEFMRSLLYTCCRSGYKECVKYLLSKGCSVNSGELGMSTPLHVASYYSHKEIVILLLNYGASNKICNKDERYPSDEGNIEIRDIILKSQNDQITKLLSGLIEKGLGYFVQRINENDVIRIYKRGGNNQSLLSNFIQNRDEYQRAFHGTQFQSLASIFEHGLKLPGDRIQDGQINIRPNHIQTPYLNKQNWPKALFLSPSPFYSSFVGYSQRVTSNGIEYCCLIEALLKKGSFGSYKNTANHTLIEGEPELLELRVAQDEIEEWIPCNPQECVEVFSILFINMRMLNDNSRGNYQQVVSLLNQYPQE